MKTNLKTEKLAKNESITLPTEPGAIEAKFVSEQHDTQLIPVTEGEIGGVKCLVVDARSLHEKLGVGRDFTNWIKNRIESYGYSEGEDYQNAISPSLGNQNLRVNGGDHKSRQYSLTLDMAKELAMVEKNAVGRAVRRYFIQCEKELLKPLAQPQKALELKKEAESYLKDWDGKPYEGYPMGKHLLQIMILISKGPRKEAYIEYARSLTIVGESKKAVAEEMAEGAYDKGISKNIRKFIDQYDMLKNVNMDLNVIKKMFEKEGLI